MRYVLSLLSITLALVSSCVTPMSSREIDELTTCRGVDMKQVRKNLLLAGYGVTTATDEDLVTDYKQVNGGSFQRITIVKMDKDTLRFKIRKRSEYYSSVPTGGSRTSVASNDGKTVTTISNSQNSLVKDSNESDQSYFQEYREEYLNTKQEVCGSERS